MVKSIYLTLALALVAGMATSDESLRAKIGAKFPMPDFPDLDVVTENWSRLPELKSPKFVTVDTDVRYDFSEDAPDVLQNR